MSGFLLDTNVVSEFTSENPNPQVVASVADQTELWLSLMVVHEMEYVPSLV